MSASDPEETNGGNVESVLALKSCGMFTDLDVHALLPLASRVRYVELPAGERIRQAPEGWAFERVAVFVHEGTIRDRSSSVAREFGAGSIVGLARCLGRSTEAFELEAVTDAAILLSHRRELIEAMEESFPVQRAVVMQLERRALEAQDAQPSVRGQQPNRPAHSRAIGEHELGAQIRLLSETHVLQGLGVHTIGRLVLRGDYQRVEAGERLWSRGDAADYSILVLSGVLEWIERDQGERGGVGNLFGLTEALAGGARRYDAVAVEPLLLLRLNAEAFYDTIEDDPEAAEDLVTVLAAALLPTEPEREAAPEAWRWRRR